MLLLFSPIFVRTMMTTKITQIDSPNNENILQHICTIIKYFSFIHKLLEINSFSLCLISKISYTLKNRFVLWWDKVERTQLHEIVSSNTGDSSKPLRRPFVWASHACIAHFRIEPKLVVPKPKCQIPFHVSRSQQTGGIEFVVRYFC